MVYIADLHPHSKYARACSPKLDLENINKWANLKGLQIIGTADFTHPFWFSELKQHLIEIAPGLYRYRSDSGMLHEWPLYVTTVETSHIFTQGGNGRRIHLLILAPSLEVAGDLNKALTKAGVNLLSDGRPMMGLSLKQMAQLVGEISEECLIIPTHIWTPWFGVFGDRGGFDSLDEGFGDFAKYIYAIETGLSSDPAMNWRVGELDTRQILSFSDAHSPWKMGREATVFDLDDVFCDGYRAIRGAVTEGDQSNRIHSTIEFFPEEGKYYYTGHRKCGICQSPQETKAKGARCPVCGRMLTVGVMHRVENMSTRTEGELHIRKCEDGLIVSEAFSGRPGYRMLIPLTEIIAEVEGVGVSTKTVLGVYHRLVNCLKSEFNVLLNAPLDEIKRVAGDRVGEGVGKVRRGELVIEPGFDGQYGVVRVWGEPGEVEPVGPVQETLL